MKNIGTIPKLCLLSFFLAIGFSCEENDTVITDTNEIEFRFIETLPSDPLFNEYANNLRLIVDKIQVKNDVDLQMMNSEAQLIDSGNEIVTFLENYTENPEESIEIFNSLAKSSNDFLNAHSEFNDLDEATKINIIDNSLSAWLSKNSAVSTSSSSRTEGDCEDQRASSYQNCDEVALIEAAGCGILSPTLVLAGICAVAVIGVHQSCVNNADRNYDICTN